ncbi:MAG TPA: hypothetical protein VFN65_13090 [Solirubrobacteraceae bacterium]|nr:hypothetical protein [Solirubrobacteraceae bacterium]
MPALFHITTLTAPSPIASERAGAVRTVACGVTLTAGMVDVPRLRTLINAGEKNALDARCAC